MLVPLLPNPIRHLISQTRCLKRTYIRFRTPVHLEILDWAMPTSPSIWQYHTILQTTAIASTEQHLSLQVLLFSFRYSVVLVPPKSCCLLETYILYLVTKPLRSLYLVVQRIPQFVTSSQPFVEIIDEFLVFVASFPSAWGMFHSLITHSL